MLLRVAMEIIGTLVIAGLVGAGVVWLGQKVLRKSDTAEPPRDALLSDTRLHDRIIDLSADEVRVHPAGRMVETDSWLPETTTTRGDSRS